MLEGESGKLEIVTGNDVGERDYRDDSRGLQRLQEKTSSSSPTKRLSTN